MIVKGSTIGVYIYVSTEDGLPATGKASSIVGSYFINTLGSMKTAIQGATFEEIDPDYAPGWYEFPFTFNYVGTIFMIFQCDGCIIAPWEEQVVDLSDLKDVKSCILKWSVAGNTLTLYNNSGTSTGTYDITTDTDGNIVKVETHSGS